MSAQCNSAMESFIDTQCFLSPNVRHLLCVTGAAVTTKEEEDHVCQKCLDDEGLLQWDYLETRVFQGINIENDVNSFEELVHRLSPVFQAVDGHVSALSEEEFRSQYYDRFRWTGMAEHFMDCFITVRNNSSVGNSLCLLLATAALERSLGDLYLLMNSPCPSILRDLLATEELKNVLGDIVILCLRVLIGPPTSLNLRNIVWHGFAAPHDVSVRYSNVLLVLTASLGALLDTKNPERNIPHRLPLSLPQMEQLKHLFSDFTQADLSVVCQVFCKSGVIAKIMLPYWKSAVQYYREQRYGLCVVLLLTQLEHSLRQVFASANNCLHRVLTAESSVLFTTFDEMLCASLPDGSTNAIIEAVGVSFMEMLLDLLVHPEGPRLRDHVSHGELDIQAISQDVANYVLIVCTTFCLSFSKENDIDRMEACMLLQNIIELSKSYTSVFHPISQLQSELSLCITSLEAWKNLSHPSKSALQYITWDTFTEVAFLTSTVYSTARIMLQEYAEECDTAAILRSLNAFAEVSSLQTFCTKTKYQTLFRPRNEVELVALLRRIIRESVAVVDNVSKTMGERFQQWQEKKLRSRQRINYVRLLNSVPRFSTGLRLSLLIVACEIQKVNSISSHPTSKFRMLIK